MKNKVVDKYLKNSIFILIFQMKFLFSENHAHIKLNLKQLSSKSVCKAVSLINEKKFIFSRMWESSSLRWKDPTAIIQLKVMKIKISKIVRTNCSPKIRISKAIIKMSVCCYFFIWCKAFHRALDWLCRFYCRIEVFRMLIRRNFLSAFFHTHVRCILASLKFNFKFFQIFSEITLGSDCWFGEI